MYNYQNIHVMAYELMTEVQRKCGCVIVGEFMRALQSGFIYISDVAILRIKLFLHPPIHSYKMLQIDCAQLWTVHTVNVGTAAQLQWTATQQMLWTVGTVIDVLQFE
jgi:hypothetical protein